MSRQPYRGISEAQSAANADALARRGSPYVVANEVSARIARDYRRRQPANLREAEHYVRRAYSEEVPPKLHEGPDSIGPDGTPRMTPQAEGYIFGSAGSSDARKDPETGEWDALSYFRSPFRAALDNLAHGHETERKHGAIVSHVAIGGQRPREAAIREGVPAWCAEPVAEYVLRAFLRNLSDMRLTLPSRQDGAVA